MSISADELSQALSISRRAVTRYVAAGCPHWREGSGSRAPLRFDLEKVKRWMYQTARRGGGAGRPPEGLEPFDGEGIDGLDMTKSEDLVKMGRIVNIQIKRLEVQKRERLEKEATGELVELEEVKRAWAAQIEIVHARFRALPSLLASRLVGKDYDEMRDVLEEELRSVLVSFAREELPV